MSIAQYVIYIITVLMKPAIDSILLLFNYFVHGAICLWFLKTYYRSLHNACNETGRILGEAGY